MHVRRLSIDHDMELQLHVILHDQVLWVCQVYLYPSSVTVPALSGDPSPQVSDLLAVDPYTRRTGLPSWMPILCYTQWHAVLRRCGYVY